MWPELCYDKGYSKMSNTTNVIQWYPNNRSSGYGSIKKPDSPEPDTQYPNASISGLKNGHWSILNTWFDNKKLNIWTFKNPDIESSGHDLITGHSISGFVMSGYQVLLDSRQANAISSFW